MNLLAMLGISDVIGRANIGIAVVTAASVEARLVRTANTRPRAFINI